MKLSKSASNAVFSLTLIAAVGVLLNTLLYIGGVAYTGTFTGIGTGTATGLGTGYYNCYFGIGIGT